MDPVFGVIIGAVVALGGGAVTTLLAPWVARKWTKADRLDQRAKDREAALRQAVEDYLSVLWKADLQMAAAATGALSEAAQRDPTTYLAVVHEFQQAEAHVGLMLTKDEEPIYMLIVNYGQFIIDRVRSPEAGAADLLPARQEIIAQISRWLNKDESAAEAKAGFDGWLRLHTLEPGDPRGEMGGHPGAV